MLIMRRLPRSPIKGTYNEIYRWSIEGIARSTATSAPKGTQQEVKPISEMPGLKSVPLLGSLPFLMMEKDFHPTRVHIIWETLAKRYGKIVKIHIPMISPFVGLSDPVDIETMYKLTMKEPIREGFHSMIKIRREAVDNFFENKMGLLMENGSEWQRVRSRVQNPMMKPTNIFKYLPKVDEVALDFVKRIGDLQLKHGEMPENFIEELYKWALESIGLVALNRRLGCLDANISPDSDQMQLIHNVNEIFESMSETELGLHTWRLFPTKAYKRLKNAHGKFVNIVFKYIQIAEEELKQKVHSEVTSQDSTLLEVYFQTEGLTRKDILTIMLDLFFAGIDTTTHSLAFTLYCLSRNPKAQERLHDELDDVLGDGKEVLTFKHLAKLSFTKACIKESMRLFPTTIGAVRTLSEDAVIRGFLIPKGYQIINLQMVTTQDENNFVRAKEFLPERWDRDRPLGRSHPFAHMPFSHGTRMCIGRRIAEQEMYTFLARVMHRYKVDYKYEDMEIITKLISCPSQPLRFKFTDRK